MPLLSTLMTLIIVGYVISVEDNEFGEMNNRRGQKCALIIVEVKIFD